MSIKDNYQEFWRQFISIANQRPELVALHGRIVSRSSSNHALDVNHQGIKYRYNIWYSNPKGDIIPNAVHVAIGSVSSYRTKYDKEHSDWVEHGHGNLETMDKKDWPDVIEKMIDAMLNLNHRAKMTSEFRAHPPEQEPEVDKARQLNNLGTRLQNARVNRGLTQEQVAAEIGIPRTALVQIEAGNRSVSSQELVALAKLYHRNVALLLTDEENQEDENLIVAFCRLRSNFEQDPELRQHVLRCVEIFEEGKWLERLLGERQEVIPAYLMSEPCNHAEAVKQGEAVAIQERKRLNLGSGSIADVAELISSQGIWASATKLPDDCSGLFLNHSTIGMAIVVNEDHARKRRRFSYAHEFAHALLDRNSFRVAVSDKQNARDLTERRANAFAGEFLMPAEGVREMLGRFDKGGGSREMKSLWSEAMGTGEFFEKRNAPRSQVIGYQDVAYLAHEFVVSYDTALYRLSDMGIINRQEVIELIDRRIEGQKLLTLLKMNDPEEERFMNQDQPRLVSQVGLLAIEAFRRELISGGRLLDVCEMLDIDGEALLTLARTLK